MNFKVRRDSEFVVIECGIESAFVSYTVEARLLETQDAKRVWEKIIQHIEHCYQVHLEQSVLAVEE